MSRQATGTSDAGLARKFDVVLVLLNPYDEVDGAPLNEYVALFWLGLPKRLCEGVVVLPNKTTPLFWLLVPNSPAVVVVLASKRVGAVLSVSNSPVPFLVIEFSGAESCLVPSSAKTGELEALWGGPETGDWAGRSGFFEVPMVQDRKKEEIPK